MSDGECRAIKTCWRYESYDSRYLCYDSRSHMAQPYCVGLNDPIVRDRVQAPTGTCATALLGYGSTVVSGEERSAPRGQGSALNPCSSLPS